MTKNFWTRDDGRLHPYVYFILIFFPLACGLIGLSMGRMDIKISEIILFFKNLIGGGQVDPLMESLIINIRLPRVLTALIVGGGLTAAGIAFQALFSNPLATPDILGVTSAASLGAVLGIILSLGTMGIQVLAMIFGLLSILITINLVKRDETATLITASSVSICGQIGWIGLIIPHLVRLMVGSNNLYTLPLGISFGAGFMVLIEALSRTVSVIELPISILTAIIGAPIFIILMRRSGGIFK